MTQVVTLAEVDAAFEALLEVVGRECDPQTVQTVYRAKVDVVAILAGEWPAPTEALVAADAGEVEL